MAQSGNHIWSEELDPKREDSHLKTLEESSPGRGNGQGPWGMMETDLIEALQKLVRLQKHELQGKRSVMKSHI